MPSPVWMPTSLNRWNIICNALPTPGKGLSRGREDVKPAMVPSSVTGGGHPRQKVNQHNDAAASHADGLEAVTSGRDWRLNAQSSRAINLNDFLNMGTDEDGVQGGLPDDVSTRAEGLPVANLPGAAVLLKVFQGRVLKVKFHFYEMRRQSAGK